MFCVFISVHQLSSSLKKYIDEIKDLKYSLPPARLFGTAVQEGGEFLAKQAEANEPVLETVGNISTTIGRSGFVQGVGRSAGTVVRSTSCLIMCSITPAGQLREECEQRNCNTGDRTED